MMTETTLLIVDVQNDFCPGGALPVPKGDEVVEPLNSMMRYAIQRKWMILASRDFHPAVTTHFAEFGGKWPPHCVQNTEGAFFHPKLSLEYMTVLNKGTKENEDGYSPFDVRTPTGWMLEYYLRAADIKELYIGGLATDYCVKAAVLDSVKKGFATYLLVDACRGVNVNPGDGETAIREMALAGAIITTTKEILELD